jgi:branched-chain amino acid aminotransferase
MTTSLTSTLQGGHVAPVLPVQQIMATDPAHARLPHDARYARGSAYVNGKYCPVDEATVPLLDLGFRHADAAYDVVSASRGLFFRLDDHLERFERSCALFRLANPNDREETVGILSELLRLAGTRDAYVWWCVTRGRLREGGESKAPEDYLNGFYAYVVPYRFIADDAQRGHGIGLMVSQRYIRIPAKAVDPRAKNFHWMDLQLSLFEAHDAGFDFSVLCDADGLLTESPGANIFLIKDGALFTPDTGCLEGITRQTTLELAAALDLAVHVGALHVDRLRDADEAFITSSAGGIMPVSRVDGVALGAQVGPGKLTTRLHNLYWQKRWEGWLGTAIDYAGMLPPPASVQGEGAA